MDEAPMKPEDEKNYKNCIRASKAFSSRVKIKRLTPLQKILKNRYQSRSVYYFTCGRKLDEKRLQEAQEKKKSPYHFMKNVEDCSYRTEFRQVHQLMRERSRHYTCLNRPNHMSRLKEGKLERLYVSETETELPGKSVTENIDPEFFSIVSGTPIREKFVLTDYLQHYQSLFLINLQIGYKYDETYLIEEQFIEEKKRMADIRKRFEFYSECFDKFLGEDHSTSLELLKIADEETKKSKMKREKIRTLLRDCGFYRTKILILDEQWRIARVYQKFLYQISPRWWRQKYDFIHKNKESDEIQTSDSSLFGKQQTGSLTHVPSIITIIDQFIEEIEKAEAPTLYFQDPMELLQIFYELEKSNLLALLQCEELREPAQQMEAGLEKARNLFKQEVDVLREHLNYLEGEVVFEENRSREFEQKAKFISMGLFKDLIVDKYTLNLYVNVEDCFEICVAPNDSNLTLLMMMEGIEHTQETLMIYLDNLPNEIVMKALQTCYREDAKIMKEAHEATKMMAQIENLMKTLRKSLEPIKKVQKTRKLVWRSEPPTEKMELEAETRVLTKEELSYLHFFTDFCAATDDPEIGKQLCAQRKYCINVDKV